ncbi:MAG: hypothetical protein Q9175_005661 [Cornicularia normoerica]
MQILPLQQVTVIVGGDLNQAQTAQNRWTIFQKREMAESLRSKLLDSNGQQALAAETQAHKAARKKMKAQPQADKVARRALREERERAREDEGRTSSSTAGASEGEDTLGWFAPYTHYHAGKYLIREAVLLRHIPPRVLKALVFQV